MIRVNASQMCSVLTVQTAGREKKLTCFFKNISLLLAAFQGQVIIMSKDFFFFFFLELDSL